MKREIPLTLENGRKVLVAVEGRSFEESVARCLDAKSGNEIDVGDLSDEDFDRWHALAVGVFA